MKMNKEFIMPGIFGLLFIVVVLSSYFFVKTRCLESYSYYHPQFTFFTGCRVEWNGKMTPVDIVREIK